MKLQHIVYSFERTFIVVPGQLKRWVHIFSVFVVRLAALCRNTEKTIRNRTTDILSQTNLKSQFANAKIEWR
jgi:hypothetical protein